MIATKISLLISLILKGGLKAMGESMDRGHVLVTISTFFVTHCDNGTQKGLAFMHI